MALSLNWSQAEQYCVYKGGHLASIHNGEENDFIKRWCYFIHNNITKAFFLLLSLKFYQICYDIK